jgi:cytochrome b561
MINGNLRYTKTAVVLHWLIAIGIFSMFALGWFMSGLPKEAPKQTAYDLFNWGLYTWQMAEPVSPRTFYYNLHKSLGVTLLAIIAIRILWRITHKPPAYLSTLKAWEKKLATGTHHLLYMLMIALPVSGLVMSAYSKYGVKWFGIPFIKGLDNNAMREFYLNIHVALGWVVLLFVILHIAGALKHKLIDKDETLKRMSL